LIDEQDAVMNDMNEHNLLELIGGIIEGRLFREKQTELFRENRRNCFVKTGGIVS
jgi:hypothetical protein